MVAITDVCYKALSVGWLLFGKYLRRFFLEQVIYEGRDPGQLSIQLCLRNVLSVERHTKAPAFLCDSMLV